MTGKKLALCVVPIIALISMLACGAKSTKVDKPDIIIPNPPSNLIAQALSATEIRLTWNDNSDNETFFAIYRFEREQSSFVVIGRNYANSRVYADIDVQDSTQYQYYVVAERGDTSSDKSNLAIATTLVYGIYYVGRIEGRFPEARLATGNSTLFLSSEDSTLSSVNVWFPSLPVIDQRYQVPGGVRSIEKAGDLIYLALGLGGMVIVSAYDPVHLATLGRCYSPNATSAVYPAGEYAYAKDGADLYIMDITNSYQPSQVGAYSNPALVSLNAMLCESVFAYAACGDSGLQVLNIFNRINPHIEGHLDTPGDARDLAKAGEIIYLADGIGGLKVIGVFNPAQPALFGAYQTSGEATAVTVNQNYAYIADSAVGLLIVDISTPSVPRYAAMYRNSEPVSDIAVVDGYIYLAGRNNGVTILQYNP